MGGRAPAVVGGRVEDYCERCCGVVEKAEKATPRKLFLMLNLRLRILSRSRSQKKAKKGALNLSDSIHL